MTRETSGSPAKNAEPASSSSPPAAPHQPVGRGFVFLNITQFLGAANDNILKQVLIFGVAAGGIWANLLGNGGQAIASMCLALPFVLFSGFAGQFSDKYSKRTVSIVSKWSEVLIGLVAMAGLLMVNLWLVLAALFLIALQSTFFSPAKFGILPEIVKEGRLSRANGTINMFTYIAIILGSAVGGPIYDAYAPDPQKFPNAEPMLWLPGTIILIVGALGTLAAYGIPRVPAQNPKLKIRFELFRSYIDTWREIRGTTLASVIVAWSAFYLIVAGIAVLILPDYKEILDITASQTSILMALLGIAIGVGDFVAGRISGHGIRPSLIPIGLVGTMVGFAVLALLPPNFWLVVVLLSATGFLAGFTMVPLQTMVQHLSSEEQRGRVLGLWNCTSFVGIILGNLIFLGLRQIGIPSNQVFFACAALTLGLLAYYLIRWKKPFNGAVAGHTA